MARRERSRYNPVSSSEDVDVLESHNPSSAGDNTSLPAENGALNPLANTIAIPGEQNSKQSHSLPVNDTTSLVDSMEKESITSEGYSDSDSGITIQNKITLLVLDGAQKRFRVDADPDWTVPTFKKVGCKIHKVVPAAQRLIFRGRMLEDTKTLREMGIHQDEVIIHLFPKPRVKVVTDVSMASSSANSEENNNGGAHVPEIILDEEEQERRGQILVLGSYEIAEAQNNVRLLSLLLGTISFMRLLTLVSIATGADEVPVYQDDLSPPEPGGGLNGTDDGLYPHYDYEPRVWENKDYLDLVVSTVGFLVARLGMKATQENTSRMAYYYLVGTLVAGILWNVWNAFEFVVFVQDNSGPTDDDSKEPLTNDDFRTIALFTVLLPLGIWIMCCARAWQFRHLIAEAEQEAADRMRSDLNLTEGDNASDEDPAMDGNAQELDDLSASSQTRRQEMPSIV